MKLNTTHSLLVAFLSLASAGLLSAAETTTSLDKTDQAFVAQAALSGKAEVQVSQLAVKKGTHAEVKAIAALIVEDHKAVNKQIIDLAKSKSLSLTSSGDPDADKVVATLEKDANGDAFDRAYLTQLQKSHKASVAAYTEAAKESQDMDVKAWAGTTLVAIQAHLDRIDLALAAL
jgi:putative membrane protein